MLPIFGFASLMVNALLWRRVEYLAKALEKERELNIDFLLQRELSLEGQSDNG